jgi:hypothetical protein
VVLTESENPSFNVEGIRIDRHRASGLGVIFRFETEDGHILISSDEIKRACQGEIHTIKV